MPNFTRIIANQFSSTYLVLPALEEEMLSSAGDQDKNENNHDHNYLKDLFLWSSSFSTEDDPVESSSGCCPPPPVTAAPPLRIRKLLYILGFISIFTLYSLVMVNNIVTEQNDEKTNLESLRHSGPTGAADRHDLLKLDETEIVAGNHSIDYTPNVVTEKQKDSLPTSDPESESIKKVSNSSILYTKEEIRTIFPEVPAWMDQFLSSQPISTHIDTLNDINSKFIVLTCHSYKGGTYPEACGGLSDRMMRLPYYVWLCHKTGRKLLIHWFNPHPLEMFFDVAFDDFDWRIPDGFFVPEFEAYANRSWTEYRNERRIVWHHHIEKPEFVNKRLIIANTNIAKIPDETTFLNGTSREKVLGAIFHRMFKPSAELMKRILSQYDAHPGLTPREYSVAHVRAKWPSGGIILNNRNGDGLGGGLNMIDTENKIKVHRIADNAAFCAQKAMPETAFIYITSDSNEIADYLINESPVWSNKSVTVNVAGKNQTHAQVISRLDYKVEPAHLITPGLEMERYLGIFVDLWMMVTSKCLAQGLGGFGHFGSELSGNHYSCRVRHRNYGTDILPDCPRPRKALLLNQTDNV